MSRSDNKSVSHHQPPVKIASNGLIVGQVFDPYDCFNGIFVPISLFGNRDLTDFSKLLYARLVYYKGRPAKDGTPGVCFVGVDELVKESGKSLATVKRSLHQLEEAGLIHRKARKQEQDTAVTEFLWAPILEASLRGKQDGSKMSPPTPIDSSKMNGGRFKNEPSDGSKMSHALKEEKIQLKDSLKESSSSSVPPIVQCAEEDEEGDCVSSDPKPQIRTEDEIQWFRKQMQGQMVAGSDPPSVQFTRNCLDQAPTWTVMEIVKALNINAQERVFKPKSYKLFEVALKNLFSEWKGIPPEVPEAKTKPQTQTFAGCTYTVTDGVLGGPHPDNKARRSFQQSMWHRISNSKEMPPDLKRWMGGDGLYEFCSANADRCEAMLNEIINGQHPIQLKGPECERCNDSGEFSKGQTCDCYAGQERIHAETHQAQSDRWNWLIGHETVKPMKDWMLFRGACDEFLSADLDRREALLNQIEARQHPLQKAGAVPIPPIVVLPRSYTLRDTA